MNERLIEFRAIATSGKMRGKYVYGSYISNNVDCPCIIDIDAEQHEIDLSTRGQYIGLEDVKGKKIFGKMKVRIDQCNPEIQVVAFIEGAFCTTDVDTGEYIADINMWYPSSGCQLETIGE